MSMFTSGPVCLLDVDNPLLDNDRVTADLKRFLEREVGPERTRRYWELFEQLRNELGYADYLGALQRYRDEYPRDPRVLHLSPYLIDYPFANRLYPESLDVIEWLKELGQVAILSDGDVVFQPRKVDRSEEHTSELQSRPHLVCRLLLGKKKTISNVYQCRSR